MPDTTQPNILIIYADQLRHDAIHALGNTRIQTPNIDRLVAQGIAFTQAISSAPVCLPARWSLHSGQYTTTHQAWSNHHEGPRPTQHLPGELSKAGYRTALIGKNHSFLQAEDLDVYQTEPPAQDIAAQAAKVAWLQQHTDDCPRLGREATAGGSAGDDDRHKTDAALAFIAETTQQPFFCWLSYLHPHTPNKVGEPWFSMYADHKPFGDPQIEGDLATARKPFRQQFHQHNNDAILPFTLAETEHLRRVYAGQVSMLDAEVGRVLDYLEANDRMHNTQIWFLSDHGDYLGDHGLYTKSPALYDCLIRTPLIVCGPGTATGVQSEALLSHIDIMPTILAQCGCAIPEAVQGTNCSDWLAGQSGSPRSHAFAEYGVPGQPYNASRLAAEGITAGSQYRKPTNPVPWEGNPVSLAGRIRMIRTSTWKFIREFGGTDELYDLANDPYELQNLAGHPMHADIERELQHKLDGWTATLPNLDQETRLSLDTYREIL